jgi:hypothetical protein
MGSVIRKTPRTLRRLVSGLWAWLKGTVPRWSVILLTFYIAFVTVRWFDDRERDACISQVDVRTDLRDVLDRNHDLLDGILIYLDERDPEPSAAVEYLLTLVRHAREDVDSDYPELSKKVC